MEKLYKMTNICVEEDTYEHYYYIKINRMCDIGEYSEPLLTGSVDFISRELGIKDLSTLLKENNAYEHFPGDAICFKNYQNAKNIVDKIIPILCYNKLKED